jgi:2-polyprenyl-3-methyl-5-hydroxy-6-metoxy-1,4-benzoquinol methylase
MKEKTRKKLEKIVKNSYSQTAEEFSLSREKEIWPKLKEMADIVENNTKILDLGCGNGRLLKAFEGKKIDYLGCDQEKKLISIAQKNWPNNKFIVSSLEQIPNESFDYIFIIAVIHHIPSREKRLEVFKNLIKHLKPKGKIIVSVWNLRKTRPKLILKTYFKHLFKESLEFGDVLFPWKKNKGQELVTRYYHAFSKRGLKNLAKKTGYKIEKIEEGKFNIWLIISKN